MSRNGRELSRSRLDALLDAALQRVSVPPRSGVVLEGSIAEGFGNESSDVDFLVVVDDGDQVGRFPTILFLDGRRVEIRMRSAERIRRHARRVNEAARSRRAVTRLSLDDIDVYQRFARGTVMRATDVVGELRAEHHLETLATVAAACHEATAGDAVRQAAAALHLGDAPAAIGAARRALVAAAKAWAARHGETYAAPKWISVQLTRAGLPASLRDGFERLLSPGAPPEDARRYVDDCFAAVQAFGIAVKAGIERLVLCPCGGITTWQIGEAVYLIRDRREVLLLDRKAARVWRSLVFHVPLAELVGETAGDEHDAALAMIGTFHRLGLVGLGWGGRTPSWTRTGTIPPLEGDGPFVSIRGVPAAWGVAGPVAQIPFSAMRFIFAGGELVWASIALENVREDYRGALATGQWKVAEAALRAMVRWGCQIVFSSFGVNPPPAYEEIALRLGELRGVPHALGAEAAHLEFVCVDGERGAHELHRRIEAFLAQAAAVSRHAFPASFDSDEDWRRTIEIGHDWLRVAGFLDQTLDPAGRTFPIEEARDLLVMRSGSRGASSTAETNGAASPAAIPGPGAVRAEGAAAPVASVERSSPGERG